MSSRAKNIAVVGAGLVGLRHIAAIESVDQAALCAIVDPDEAAQQIAQQHGVPWFDNLEALFNTQTPDGIILSTPTLLHESQAIMCLERGCATLVEKPITASVAEGKALVKLSEQQGVPLLVGHHRRFNPVIKKAKEVIAEGRIGHVRAIQAMCWFYKPDDYFAAAPWRTSKGAGPISVNLIHDVDLLRYLCGEIIAVQASAVPSRRGHENEDIAAAVLEFDNGALGTLSVSDATVSPWSWELTSGEYPIYPKTNQSCYMVGGSEGALSIPDLTYWQHENGADWWSPINGEQQPFISSDPLVNQIAHFVAVMNNEADPIVSGREGLSTLKVIEAIQISAQQGIKIDIKTFFQ